MKGLKAKYDQVDSDMEEYLEEEEGAALDQDDTYGEEFVTATDIDAPPAKKQKK